MYYHLLLISSSASIRERKDKKNLEIGLINLYISLSIKTEKLRKYRTN